MAGVLLPSTQEELIATVRMYYDSSNAFLFTTEPSFETVRRQALWTQWIANRAPWMDGLQGGAEKRASHLQLWRNVSVG